MTDQISEQPVCFANANSCEDKCLTSLGSAYDCNNPCGCYGDNFAVQTFNPATEKCESACLGYGGSGQGPCVGTLLIRYQVRRCLSLSGDVKGMAGGSIYIGGSSTPTFACYACPMSKCCEVDLTVSLTFGTDDPKFPPEASWLQTYSGTYPTTIGSTFDAAPGGSGTVRYKWYPYIIFADGTTSCGGYNCGDPFDQSPCGFLFTLGCAAPFCACCCGCEKCSQNAFGEQCCHPADQNPDYNFRTNCADLSQFSGKGSVKTEVTTSYQWSTGPNADGIWRPIASVGSIRQVDVDFANGLFDP